MINDAREGSPRSVALLENNWQWMIKHAREGSPRSVALL